MAHKYIEIHGARENNLQNVSLRIPKEKITIFTGVSGSGKSSLVFDTIAAEAQRQLYENFSTFIRNLLPRYPQPDVDSISNLSMAVVVDQKRLGGGAHSTVGTITDIYAILRLLYSRIGKPSIGASNLFSFNDPQGMCPECSGVGRKMTVIADDFLDMSKSLSEGAVQVSVFASWETNTFRASGFFDVNKKLRDFTPEEMDLLLHSKPRKIKMQVGENVMNVTYAGIIEKFTQSYIKRDLKTLSERTQQAVAPYIAYGPCNLCHGARLSPAALGVTINGHTIAGMTAMQVSDLVPALQVITDPRTKSTVDSLTERLRHVIDIGLDYLSLDRETDTLSGGESQRIKMVKNLTSSLVDVTYIFDEPSVGLHPRDVHLLNELLKKLRDKGNTIIVVEHDPDVIKIADHVVDVGPRAGKNGGHIVFEGSYQDLLNTGTLTGIHLKQALPIKDTFRTARGILAITNAKANNLQDVSVDIPTGVITAITGVAGSGKSSLILQEFLSQHPEAIVIDQSAVGASTRSNPATYTGIMDDVRKAFASANHVDASLFSFNSKGACKNCKGLGVTYTDLAFLDGVKTPCEVCKGKRFKDEVLAYRLNGKSISDILEITITEALKFFEQKEIVRRLQALSDVGIGYLTLGQPLSTLSGGECQRIKLASYLHKKGNVYVMDEPTTGLHMSDITHLLAIMNRLVDAGNTVIVIEHNLDIIRSADWIIDMGPEGGKNGGRIIFEGTPRDLKQAKQSLTSAFI